jgi:hypothetical protein
MDESEWLHSTEPDVMLAFVAGRSSPALGAPQTPLSERKLRLYLVGCCRRHKELFIDRGCWEAVELVERLADGQAEEAERVKAAEVAQAAFKRSLRIGLDHSGLESKRRKIIALLTADAAAMACRPCSWLTQEELCTGWAPTIVAMPPRDRQIRAGSVPRQMVKAVEEYHAAFHGEGEPEGELVAAAERAAQTDLLRCIAGNPFRAKPSLSAALLAWDDDCIVKLATGIYEEQDFSPERMGVLADALEEAGVTDEVLGHCRGLARHCRGCWVVDACLGRS